MFSELSPADVTLVAPRREGSCPTQHLKFPSWHLLKDLWGCGESQFQEITWFVLQHCTVSSQHHQRDGADQGHLLQKRPGTLQQCSLLRATEAQPATLQAQAVTPLSPMLQLGVGEKTLGLSTTTLTLKQEQTHILNIDFHLRFLVRTILHQFNTQQQQFRFLQSTRLAA